MPESQNTAEAKALEATQLPCFDDLNLHGVRSKLQDMLKLIGRDGIFREYTLHDASHITRMLAVLDWLVPEKTQQAMTPADWLLTTLAVYFHDLGLLVTREEFDRRAESDFDEFCQKELFAGDAGPEYEAKARQLGDGGDIFLYQEYVRARHAARIGDWISGRASKRHGVSEAAATEVAALLAPLPAEFRKDLAVVCESHHEDDLYDRRKYKIAQPYGDSDSETANVQYAAVLLRAADLLHITADRTPSVMFRLISPQDPVSQREWAKQAAVRRVRPQKGRDREGNFSDTAPRDTIEVHATFSDAAGFFGLGAYLRYAGRELRQCSDWVRATAREYDAPHSFPWRFIDDSEVTASGFDPQRLSFSLDEAKILELLTGHTLYNDTSVVIRELVQNALDAARLQALIDGEDEAVGEVVVEWDTGARVLTVRDNGTGMTQEVIENNLLKAGASRYQEERFQKEHADFSPISRFGIGVLSTFMIADSVTVTTVSPDDAEARQLSLKTVHDRYLVRLLDKARDEPAAALAPHGTEVRLHVRQSAEIPDVLAALQRWIVFPRCTVTARIDDGDEVSVGYASPTAALEHWVEGAGFELAGPTEPADGAHKVIEKDYDGVRTGMVVRWSGYFQQWAFASVPQRAVGEPPPVGTCVEGIRVEYSTPGFTSDSILAVSDARGRGAPKTNVARSGLDSTSERSAMLRRIYRAYGEHVAQECSELTKARGFSVTWAAGEARILSEPLFRNPNEPIYRDAPVESVDHSLLNAELDEQRFILVEGNGKRELTTARELAQVGCLWIVDSALVRSAEGLLREIPGEASLSSLSEGFASAALELPSGVSVVGFDIRSPLYGRALEGREVTHLIIRRDQRRIDLGWEVESASPRWRAISSTRDPVTLLPTQLENLYLANEMPVIDGRDDEVAISAFGSLFLFPDSPLAAFLATNWERFQTVGTLRDRILSAVTRYLARGRQPDNVQEFLEAIFGEGVPTRTAEAVFREIAFDDMVAAFEATPVKTFDTSAWQRVGWL